MILATNQPTLPYILTPQAMKLEVDYEAKTVSGQLGITRERADEIRAAFMVGVFLAIFRGSSTNIIDSSLGLALSIIDQENKAELFYTGFKYEEIIEELLRGEGFNIAITVSDIVGDKEDPLKMIEMVKSKLIIK